MISYEPFWNTLTQKQVTKYALIYHYGISSNTLRRMNHGEAINTNTINQLCLILDCSVQDIVQFEASEVELQEIEEKRAEISSKKKKSKK